MVRAVMGGVVVAWPEGVPEWMMRLGAFGPEAAVRKGRTWFPAYGLAMRRDGYFEAVGTVALPEELVGQFLRGGSVASDARGWLVATYRGLAVGWGRGNGRVLSSRLPRSARLVVSGRGVDGVGRGR
jgi:hypothetical protein